MILLPGVYKYSFILQACTVIGKTQLHISLPKSSSLPVSDMSSRGRKTNYLQSICSFMQIRAGDPAINLPLGKQCRVLHAFTSAMMSQLAQLAATVNETHAQHLLLTAINKILICGNYEKNNLLCNWFPTLACGRHKGELKQIMIYKLDCYCQALRIIALLCV